MPAGPPRTSTPPPRRDAEPDRSRKSAREKQAELWNLRLPLGGEIDDVLTGLLVRFRIPHGVRNRQRSVPFLALFSFVSGGVSIGLMSVLAVVTGSPFIFPSLGPTAFLLFYTPTAPASSPRNTVYGHIIAVCAGYASLLVTGLAHNPNAFNGTVSWPRVVAAALSLGLTAGIMSIIRSPHPPAGATTLVVSLGILRTPYNLGILLAGVILLVLLALLINRLAGIDYPLWKRPPSRKRVWLPTQSF